jgi:hypothetical protein
MMTLYSILVWIWMVHVQSGNSSLKKGVFGGRQHLLYATKLLLPNGAIICISMTHCVSVGTYSSWECVVWMELDYLRTHKSQWSSLEIERIHKRENKWNMCTKTEFNNSSQYLTFNQSSTYVENVVYCQFGTG